MYWSSRTLSTALEELGRCAAREAERAAILLLKSGRIQGWRLFGFGDVTVTGRGLSNVIFRTVDDPMAVKRQIESVSNPVA